ncbi:MAG: ABC transporter permease [Methanoregulaceae archaeon]|nr:ABC transporter permease [Methanoregulaceae archaeon]
MHTGFLTIYWRDMIRFVRFRTLLISSLVQPALWMAFFGIAMSANFDRLGAGIPIVPGSIQVPYLTFMGAGVIAMTTLFTSLFGGIVLLFDKNWGLMREILASPLPRNHIILGIGLSGMTKSFIQAFIIIGFGLLIGVGFFAGFAPVDTIIALLGVMLFVAVFSLGFLFFSAAISISMETPEGLQGIITLLTMPIFFASNALYPVSAFPVFLQELSKWNPLTHLINGIRYFAIGDEFYSIGVHYSQTPADIFLSFSVLVGFAVSMFLVAWWRFRVAVVT